MMNMTGGGRVGKTITYFVRGDFDDDLYIIGAVCLSVTFLLISLYVCNTELYDLYNAQIGASRCQHTSSTRKSIVSLQRKKFV